MGDPWLGQVAYDKGIRILAASQPDQYAMELSSLGHGLLTYAIVTEGAKKGRADLDYGRDVRPPYQRPALFDFTGQPAQAAIFIRSRPAALAR